MKKNSLLQTRHYWIFLTVLLFGSVSVSAQNPLTDVRISLENRTISSDNDTISYDVYIENHNTSFDHIMIPNFNIRFAIPKTCLLNQGGTQAANLTPIVENAGGTVLDVMSPTISTSPINSNTWIVGFKSKEMVLTYAEGLKIPMNEKALIGRFSIKNNDGPFAIPVSFNLQYADGVTNPLVKSTVAIFQNNTTTMQLATNSTAAQPSTNFDGLGVTSLSNVIQLSINADPTVTKTKEYDGKDTAHVLTIGGLLGVQSGHNVTVSATATYDDKHVGDNKTITVKYAIDGPDKQYYSAPVDYTFNSCTITKKLLSVTGTTVTKSKVYDGSETAAVTNIGTVTGIYNDEINLGATAKYLTVGVGQNKDITVTYNLLGDAALTNNYTAPSVQTVTGGEITKKPLSVTNTVVTKTKAYDGLKSAAVTFVGDVTGKVGSEAVSLGATAEYLTSEVGQNKDITVTFSLVGDAAVTSNYSVPTFQTIAGGEITKKLLSVTGTVVTKSKVYDGSKSAAVTSVGDVTGIYNNEITLGATAEYLTVDAAQNKDITVTYSLVGDAALTKNYTAPGVQTVTGGEITKKLLSVTGTTVTKSKVYDGSETAAVTNIGTVTGIYNNEISLGATAKYPTVGIGQNKDITVTYSLVGDAALTDNYSAPSVQTVTGGEITKKPLSVTNTVVTKTKEYDGLKSAAVTSVGDVTGIYNNEISLGATAEYLTAGVAQNKDITVTYNLVGDVALTNNYSAPSIQTVTGGEITKRQLTIGHLIASYNKVYDGNDNAYVKIGELTNVVGSESVTVSYSAHFSDELVGNKKPFTVEYTIGGNDSGNYLAPVNESSQATIYKALNLKVNLQGFWDDANKKMKTCKSDNGVTDRIPGVVDKIDIELHSKEMYSKVPITIYNLYVKPDGKVVSPETDPIPIDPDISGEYYLTIRHRNSLPVTTKQSVSFGGNTLSVDFTNIDNVFSSDAAFAPMANVNGTWLMYAGDVKNDGLGYQEINIADVYEVFNKRSAVNPEIYGYQIYDLNGDATVDDADIYMVFNNRDVLLYRP